MKKMIGVILAIAVAVTAAGCGKGTSEVAGDHPNILQAEMPKKGEEIAVITTSKGEMKLRLYPEEAPKAVENFKTLAKEGYYDGLLYHRVINNFMIQTGDPTGTGAGGESIWKEKFADEISPNLHFYRGALAMANSGVDSNGSQFFVVQTPTASPEALNVIRESMTSNEELGISLNEKFYTLKDIYPDDVLAYFEEKGGAVQLEYVFGAPYTIFGQVFEGFEVIDAIAAVETDPGNNRPVEDVIMEKVEIVKYEPTA